MQDVITRTAFLEPIPNTADWQTFATALLRLNAINYTIPTPAKWVTSSVKFAGDIYLHSLNVNEGIVTSGSYPKNQAWYLSWVAYNPGNSNFVQVEVGWGTTYTDPDLIPADRVSLRFWADGKVDIYKGNDKLATESIAAKSDSLNPALPLGNKVGSQSRTIAGQTVDVYLIPCRKRDLMVLTNQGEGFCYTFEDVDATDTDPEITSAGPFFWYVPSGQATVQLAPMPYATSGYEVSRVIHFREPPEIGALPVVTVNADAPGYGTSAAAATLMESDLSGVFVPDGIKTACRLQITLTGDGTATHWVYGAQAVFPATTVLTNATEEADITEFVRRIDYSVGDSPSDVQVTLTCASPDAMGLTGLLDQSNRPIKILLDDVAIFTGMTLPADVDEGYYDAARPVIIEAKDEWSALERYQMQEATPIDDELVSDGIKEFVKMVGRADADLDIIATASKVSRLGQASQGEWANLPAAGDTPAKWILQLHHDYAATWRLGWYPRAESAGGRKFVFRPPITDPFAHRFLSLAEARAYLQDTLGYSAAKARAFDYQYVCHKFKERPIPPECNEIYVFWWDPRTRTLKAKHYRDTAAQDPTLLPSARPANWTGDKQIVGIYDASFTTEATATAATEILRDRLTPSRRGAEIESQFIRHADLSPLWRGEILNVPTKGRYRIRSLSGTFEREWENPDPDQPWQWRNFTYVAERIGAEVEPS